MAEMIRKLTIIKCGGNLDNRERVQHNPNNMVILNKLIEDLEAAAIYRLLISKRSLYTDRILLEALFQIGDIEYIARAVMFDSSEDITKDVFLKCAQMIVDSKDINLITEFSIGCFGSMQSFGNSFNIIDEYLEMIQETKDGELIKNIIEHISQMQKNEKKENRKAFIDSLIHCEFREIKTGEYKPFNYMVYEETIKFKKMLKELTKQKEMCVTVN